jgi:hypothetical protein
MARGEEQETRIPGTARQRTFAARDRVGVTMRCVDMADKSLDELRENHPHWWVILVFVVILIGAGVWAATYGHKPADISKTVLQATPANKTVTP